MAQPHIIEQLEKLQEEPPQFLASWQFTPYSFPAAAVDYPDALALVRNVCSGVIKLGDAASDKTMLLFYVALFDAEILPNWSMEETRVEIERVWQSGDWPPRIDLPQLPADARAKYLNKSLPVLLPFGGIHFYGQDLATVALSPIDISIVYDNTNLQKISLRAECDLDFDGTKELILSYYRDFLQAPSIYSGRSRLVVWEENNSRVNQEEFLEMTQRGLQKVCRSIGHPSNAASSVF